MTINISYDGLEVSDHHGVCCGLQEETTLILMS